MTLSSSPTFRVSLSHLPPADRLLIAQPWDHSLPVNAGVTALGADLAILWIGDDGPRASDADHLQRFGFSPAFPALLATVYRDAGRFCYVHLEQDGDVIEGLPQYKYPKQPTTADELTADEEKAADMEGWNIYDEGDGERVIQANDNQEYENAQVIATDKRAVAHVKARAAQGSAMHQKALRITDLA